MSKKIGFADLHHHSEYSVLDGFGKVDDHVKRAVELGHPAVAFTEHGTMRGMVDLDNAAKKHGIKPIFGIEFYVARDHRVHGLNPEQKEAITNGLKGAEARQVLKDAEDKLGLGENRHLVCVAMTDQGLRNLIRLNNIANRDGYYYKPRVDLALLAQYSEGIAASSACLGGVIAQSLLKGSMERALDDAERLHEIFGEWFSLEIQPHPIEALSKVNRQIIKIGQTLGIPLIATNDSHYIVETDWDAHDTLIALAHKRFKDDPERIRYVPGSFCMKSEEELFEDFDRNHPDIDSKIVDAAVERAAHVTEASNASLWRPKTVLLPQVSAGDPDADLKNLCLDGWDSRGIEDRAVKLGIDRDVYVKRLAYELRTIKDRGFASYFLVVHDQLDWARKQGIIIGPGRGSAAGSLVCFLTNITALDPIQWDLRFERFLAPGRTDWPDIDIDIESRRRGEVLEYLRSRYGRGRVAQIGTFSRIRGRSALKDVARTYGIGAAEIDKYTSAVVEKIERAETSDSGSMKEIMESKAMAPLVAAHPEIVDNVIRLEGNIRHVGVHPAGIITCSQDLEDMVPLERRKDDAEDGEPTLVIGYDMRHCEEVGLVKIDDLGLEHLGVIGDCVRLIEARTGDRIDIEAVTLDTLEDQAVFDAFNEIDFMGVFQFDTPVCRAKSGGVKFSTLADLAAFNALIRPGPSGSGLDDAWKRRKAKKKTPKYNMPPQVEAACPDTYGVTLYQEHVTAILTQVAGFNGADADKVRKMVAKSKGAKALETYRDQFIEGSREVSGLTLVEANHVWDMIVKFGSYGFNRAHSMAYSLIGYWCQWLKTRYPLEFFAALLLNEEQAAQTIRIAQAASRRGVKVEAPCVVESRRVWTVRAGRLVAGLSIVKGVGENAANAIEEAQPFSSFSDFLGRVNRRVVNAGVMKALAKAGAFRRFVSNRRWLVENLADLLKIAGKRKSWIADVDALVAQCNDQPDYDDGDLLALEMEVGVAVAGEHPLSAIDDLRNSVLRDFAPLTEPERGPVMGMVAYKKVGTSEGKKWAAIELEDENGERLRVKLDNDAYEQFRDVLDAGEGAIVAARLSVDNRGNAYCAYLVDLLAMRRKYADFLAGVPVEFSPWERSLTRSSLTTEELLHPGIAFQPVGATVSDEFWKGAKPLTPVLVLRAKVVRDGSSQKMAFVTVETPHGTIREVVMFSSVWAKQKVRVGHVYRIEGKLDTKRGSVLASSVRAL